MEKSKSPSTKPQKFQDHGLLLATPKSWFNYVLYLPSLIFLISMTIFPLSYSLYISFHNYTLGTGGKPDFIGFKNYATLLKEAEFWISAYNTLFIVVLAVGIELVIGTAMAFLFNRKWKGVGILRILIFIPMMLSPMVLGYFWKYMYDFQFGIINWLIAFLGIPAQSWLTDPGVALISIALVDVWQWTPFVVLLVTAGLQTIPREEYEAATIDRASAWMQFWKISLPYLRSNLMVAALFRMIDTFRMFDLVYILTGGGPGNSTQTLSVAAYKLGYQFFQTGKAAAISWLMVIIVTVMAMLLMKVLSEKKKAIPEVAP